MSDDDQLNVPADCKLSEHHEQFLPYFSLGDEIFPSKKWLMRFYPEKKQVRKSVFATTDTQEPGDALKMFWVF